MPIHIEPYNPAWEGQFEQLKELFGRHLGTLILAVEHVGSTSVPGLAAKPVLDIDLVIAAETQLPAVTAVLENLGYSSRGDLGIKDRYAFSAVAGIASTLPRHHLYCCTQSGLGLRNHLAIRDALRRDKSLRMTYEYIKRTLAAQTDDIGVYIEGKGVLLQRILLESGLSSSEVDDIERQNRPV